MTISKVRSRILEFLNKNFEIKTSKSSKITAAIVGAVTLLPVILLVEQFTSQEFSSKWILLAFSLIFPFVLSVATLFTVRFKSITADKIWNAVIFFLMPFLMMIVTEALNGVFIYNMTYWGFFGNYVVILLLYFLIYAISGRFGIAYLVVNPVLFGFAVAHSYIMDFRGTPFLPYDFLSVTTAMGVANTYDYTPTHKVITATLVFIFIIIITLKTKTPKYHITSKIITRSVAGTLAAVLMLVFYGTDYFVDLGVKPYFWNQNKFYKNYGFVLCYFINTNYLGVKEPKNYNPDHIGDYVNHIKNEEEGNKVIEDDYEKPNIICIMNESLSDLSVLGNLETNEDYMPFMRSLKENTIKGNLYVPVIGGGTSNTEFEFLTGHTTAFLPSGSIAYMLYMNKPIASLVSTVRAQGYSADAFHPYYASGWNRTEVYKNFGFDSFKSLENLLEPSILDEFIDYGSDPEYLQKLIEKTYTDRNHMLIRQYVSDNFNYEVLINDFENRDKSVPYFNFNVTMQNHGGYTTSATNFKEDIYATSVSQKYIKADKYLSLVKRSDEAFKKLIKYFSKVKEPTVICMFGDHQPTIENEFIAEAMGVESLSNLTPQQDQSRYCTPFFIWANYDIEEREIERLSSNYLSSLVLETAGIKLTEYNKYLLNLSKTLPVIDTVGYVDSEGNHYKWSDSSPYSEILLDYERVQYNNIHDQEKVDKNIFYINDYEHPTYDEEE